MLFTGVPAIKCALDLCYLRVREGLEMQVGTVIVSLVLVNMSFPAQCRKR